jgi:hypothetical protein
MKYFLLLIVLLGCAGVYLRIQQPKMWNSGLAALRVPEPSDGSTGNLPTDSPATPTPATATPAAAPSTAETVSAPPEPQVPTNTPLVISPDSKFINTDHVKAVEQPDQTSTTNQTAAPANP